MMTSMFSLYYRRLRLDASVALIIRGLSFIWIPMIWMTTACTYLIPPDLQPDLAAEQIIAGIKHTNADLVQFKCIGKITMSGPQQPVQSYRSAIAGQLKDHLRIDLFAPFGGAAGTVASDGEHLFLVLHASQEYHKKRFGDGSLQRFIKMDVTVGDLLELLVGRIPLDSALSPRVMPADGTDRHSVCLVDRWGQTRQRITLDAAGRPLQSEWFDNRHQLEFSLVVSGRQVIDGFVLPIRVDLCAVSGQKVSVLLERYEANVCLDESLFAPPPISS
jgi:hypothetical protein